MVHDSVKIGNGTRISDTAVIEENCEIGDNCFIGHYVVMRPGTKIGNNTMIAHHVIFEGNTTVGNDCLIHDASQITRSTVIEDLVFIGPGVQTCNDNGIVHRRRHIKPFNEEGPTFKRACRVATGAIILPGKVVGENAIVGAGAMVTENVPPCTIVYGNPARIKGLVDKEEII